MEEKKKPNKFSASRAEILMAATNPHLRTLIVPPPSPAAPSIRNGAENYATLRTCGSLSPLFFFAIHNFAPVSSTTILSFRFFTCHSSITSSSSFLALGGPLLFFLFSLTSGKGK